MESFDYALPGFQGYSRVPNRQSTQAEDMFNFNVRDSSLKVRRGSQVKPEWKSPVAGKNIESLMMLRKKNGINYYLASAGGNLYAINSSTGTWGSALKTGNSNNVFNGVTFFDKYYFGNGAQKFVFDGNTVADFIPDNDDAGKAKGVIPKFNSIATYSTRLWANSTDNPTSLYYSEIGNAGDWAGDGINNYTNVSETDGDAIKALLTVGNFLFILNEYSCYKLIGAAASEFQKMKVGNVGTVSARSVASLAGAAVWMSHEGFHTYSGGVITPIDFNLGYFDEYINLDYLDKVTAISHDNSYWVAVTAADSDRVNDMVLVYDSETTEWVKYQFAFSILDFLVTSEGVFAAADDGRVYRLSVGATDSGVPILAQWVSDALDLGSRGKRKRLIRIMMEVSEIKSPGIVEIYHKRDNDPNWEGPHEVEVPADLPGRTVAVEVRSDYFYNITVRLGMTARAVVNGLVFYGKQNARTK